MYKNIAIILLALIVTSQGLYIYYQQDTFQDIVVGLEAKHQIALSKAKIKERGKRLLSALPVAGLMVGGWLEKQEYDEWKQHNPDGTLEEYTLELKHSATEVLDEMTTCSDMNRICRSVRDAVEEYSWDNVSFKSLSFGS
jgi:hypothetical protein